MKLPIKLALLSSAGIVCGLVVAEVGLRLLSRDGLPLVVQWGTADGDVESRARQAAQESYGTFTYDADGFRAGSGLPYDRSVLFIGDSFTEGRGVSDDETFARAAERALRRAGLRVRSLNAGNRGFGPAQELKVLRRVLARFSVDAIVVQSFPMNDLSDNVAHGGFGVENGRLVEYEAPRVPWRARLAGVISRSWLRNSYIVRAATNAVATGDPAAPYDTPAGVDLERVLLNEIVATARARGIPIVVLVIPTKVVQAKGNPANPAAPAGELRRYEYVRELVRGLGVASIDAGEVIADLAADAASGDGGHFGKEGNRLIGEAIAERLEPTLRQHTEAAP